MLSWLNALIGRKSGAVDGYAYRTADDLTWEQSLLRRLPALEDMGNVDDLRKPRAVSRACFSRAHPTPVEAPSLVAAIPEALFLIDLNSEEAARRVDIFAGNQLPVGAEPVSHCYSGHQFGVFAGQLGDGAAISLGVVKSGSGDSWEIQLKGAGRTHYSRKADGRKVLRSSLRELLASESAHALGIPTTRAAALVTSDTTVARDVHYDGHVIHERASVLTRLSPSFLRFGSFEICIAGGPSAGQHDLLEKLIDHAVRLLGIKGAKHAHQAPRSIIPSAAAEREALLLSTKLRVAAFGEMVSRTAQLVACWMCHGFCHGVLNTDNMSILGLTLDYGPFGFMETYDPEYVCNTSDHTGRYAYHRQPEACKWNCERLAEVLGGFSRA